MQSGRRCLVISLLEKNYYTDTYVCTTYMYKRAAVQTFTAYTYIHTYCTLRCQRDQVERKKIKSVHVCTICMYIAAIH